ncbi:MAG: 3-hydroxyacyl-ACP dehydratase FabZ family protein [Pseudomonadota bacterium]
MKLEEIPPLMKRLRRGPLHRSGETEEHGGRETVERVLPHRDPFLFVDRILGVDPDVPSLLAERRVPADDPVFAGHFPGRPLFPAALQIEAIGQSSLCLWNLTEEAGRPSDVGLVVTKVEHAMFAHPVRPGDLMHLHSTIVYADDLVVSAAGQVYVGETLCAALILKVSITDG